MFFKHVAAVLLRQVVTYRRHPKIGEQDLIPKRSKHQNLSPAECETHYRCGGKISSFAKGIEMLNSVCEGLMHMVRDVFTLMKTGPAHGKLVASNAGLDIFRGSYQAVHEMDLYNCWGRFLLHKTSLSLITKFGCVVSTGNLLGCCFQFSQLDPLFASPVQLACEWQKLGRLRMGSRNCRACTVSKRKRSKQRSGPGHPWRREGQSRHFKWSKQHDAVHKPTLAMQPRQGLHNVTFSAQSGGGKNLWRHWHWAANLFRETSLHIAIEVLISKRSLKGCQDPLSLQKLSPELKAVQGWRI